MRAIAALLAVLPLAAQEDTPLFRSDVTLVRVDVQVLDRAGQRITGLTKDDFRLAVNGQPAPVSAFAYEQIPLDVVLLIDVSGSMRPHVQRIANGLRGALRSLGPDDRVALLAFDRRPRLRMELEGDHDRIAAGMEELLREERFNSGTAITRAIKESADWLSRGARADARRAVVILTDDENGDGRDEDGVLSALDRAGAALSVLQAPGSRQGMGGPRWPIGRRGGIIFGPRFPQPGPQVDILESAGIREIARETGGDTFKVEESAALEMTFARLRQRYAIFYSDPTGAAPVTIGLSESALRRHPGAQADYRRGSRWGGGDERIISRAPETPSPRPQPSEPGWGQADVELDEVDDRPAPVVSPPPPPPAAPERKGGWRKATPEDLKPVPPPKLERRKP